MNTVFAPPEAQDCRFCGSKFLPSKNPRGLCAGCTREFEYWCERVAIIDDDLALNRWMARRLMLEANRLSQGGMTGRCEAVAGKSRGWLDGFDAQCRGHAMTMRDGRKVCMKHSKATNPIYIGDVKHDPYQDFARVLSALASFDPKFKEAVQNAIARS